MIAVDWLRNAALARPDAVALEMPGRPPMSFAQLEARVVRLAGGLRSAGFSAGDRVVAVLPNGAAMVELLHAVPRLGGVLVPIDPRSTAVEIERARSLVGGKWLLLGPGVPGAVERSPWEGEVRLVHALEDEILVDPAPSCDSLGAPPPAALDLDRPHSVVFTSGTSGRPRAIVLTARNLLASALASAERLGIRSDDRWLCTLPLHHVGGLSVLVRSVILGFTTVLHGRFEPNAVAEALIDEGVNLVSLVPTTLRRTIEALGTRAAGTRLRAILLGGAAASPELLDRARALGLPIAPTYGMTEAASQVATAAPGDPCMAEGKVGRPLRGVVIRIVRGDDGVASPGEPGEILLAGPTISGGEMNADGSIRRTLVDGWLWTGDLGVLDGNGCLRILGRRDDMIVTGGENVAPDEVEAALLAHPWVAEAGVAGEPDPEWGEVVAAWIVPGPRIPTLEDLRAHCRVTLAPHKLPRRLHILASLPRTSLGKLRRSELRGTSLGPGPGTTRAVAGVAHENGAAPPSLGVKVRS